MMEGLKTIRLIALYIALFTPVLALQGQNPLNGYKWKNRVLLILGSSKSSELINAQLTRLEPLNKAFDERKILILKAVDGNLQILNGSNTHNYSKSDLNAVFNAEKADFKLILIGLDGGIKLEQKQPIDRLDLFGLIDGMPLRKAEIKN